MENLSVHNFAHQRKEYLPALTLNFLDLYVDVHKMPPTLRPSKYRSFGHFILTSSEGIP